MIALLVSQACAHQQIASPVTPQQAPAGATDAFVAVQTPTPARDSISLARFQVALPAPEGSFVCTGIPRLGVNVRTVSAAYQNAGSSYATVVVMVDSTGNLVRYAERRGPPVRPTLAPGLTKAQIGAAVAAAADSARSTTITLDYSRGRAVIANRGGGLTPQAVSAPINAVVSMDSLGKPLDRARQVLAQCDRSPR